MSTVLSAPANEQRLLIDNVDWQTYDQLLHTLEGRHLRFNYDRGRLEIMTVSSPHERSKKLLARFVEALTEELDVPILGLGNFTCRREDVLRGLEPDECWYIRNEAAVRDREQLDLDIDPPPDLVLEIEYSRTIVDRLGILAALGVPEVWRFDGERLTVLTLTAEGTYAETQSSPAFPDVPLDGIREHLQRRGQADETTLVKAFRAWVRETIAG